MPKSPRVPTENQESCVLASWMRAKGLLFCHVQNQGWGRTPGQGALLKRMGMSAGVPDFLIFERAPNSPGARGVAIELKRTIGGQVSEVQKNWIIGLRDNGWAAEVCRGADEAIRYLSELGF